MARLERGEVEEGRQMLEEALRANPGAVEVMHGLALALDMAGERLEARTLLERAHAAAPTEPGPACDLSMMYLEMESDARAARVLEPVLAAHPEDLRVHLHLAMALAKTDPVRARGHAQKALQASEPDLHQQAEMLLQALQAVTPA
jgi:Tfp pilus assembly protein PilF